MKLAKVILSGLGVMTLMAIVYLMLPSDVSSKDVAEAYSTMSSKDAYFSFLSTTEGKNEFLKDVTNSVSTASDNVMYPIKFAENSSSVYTINPLANVGWSSYYNTKSHGGADVFVRKDGDSTSDIRPYFDEALICAPVSGTITYIKTPQTWYYNNDSGFSSTSGQSANEAIVNITSDDGMYVFQLIHMGRFVDDLEEGVTHVNAGDVIGYMGSQGNSTGNHLHYTVFRNDKSGTYGTRLDPWSLNVADMEKRVLTNPTATQVDTAWTTSATYYFDSTVDAIYMHPERTGTKFTNITNAWLQESQIVPNSSGYTPKLIPTPTDLGSKVTSP